MFVASMQYVNFIMLSRNSVCGTLLPDVVALEEHQNDRSYVRELTWPTFDSLCKNLARWVVTRGPKMPIKLSKLEGDRLPSDGLLPGTMGCKQTQRAYIYIYIYIYIAYENCYLLLKHNDSFSFSKLTQVNCIRWLWTNSVKAIGTILWSPPQQLLILVTCVWD